jgi:hypothetical protein
MAIETKDLWQGAYLLTEGGWLDGVKVRRRPDGKREFVFRLAGDGVEDRARRFQDGDATCNLRKFRRQMNHLKDVVFGGAHGD